MAHGSLFYSASNYNIKLILILYQSNIMLLMSNMATIECLGLHLSENKLCTYN